MAQVAAAWVAKDGGLLSRWLQLMLAKGWDGLSGVEGAKVKKTILILALICGIAVAAYFASPLLSVHNFVSAARSGDPDRLEADVDFPAVRDSLKSQFNALMLSKMQNDASMKDNPFAGLGMMLAPAIADRMVDTIVTPDGIAALVRQGKLQPKAAGDPPKEPLDYSYEYVGIDRFRVSLQPKGGGAPAKLLFERRGLFSWKLVKIEFPADALQDTAAGSAPAAVQSATPPIEAGPTNDAALPADVAQVNFVMPNVPTPVVPIDCHMGECTWQTISSVADVKRVGNSVLRVVRSRMGTTETPDGQDYPKALGPNVKVSWRDDTSYDLCSIAHPASVSWDDDAKDFLVTPLNVVSPFGYQTGAVAEYKLVCHGISQGSPLDQNVAQLGYVDPPQAADQSHIKGPEQIFASLPAGD